MWRTIRMRRARWRTILPVCRLARTLSRCSRCSRTRIWLGWARGPLVDTWLAAGIAATRGATAAELAQALQDAGVRGAIRTFPDVTEALRYAYNAAGENDRIAAFGSFYTVAEDR